MSGLSIAVVWKEWPHAGYMYWWCQAIITNYNYDHAVANMTGFASRP